MSESEGALPIVTPETVGSLSTSEQLSLIERIADELILQKGSRDATANTAATTDGSLSVHVPLPQQPTTTAAADLATSVVETNEQRLQEQLEELLVQSHVLRTENEACLAENRELRESLAQQAARAQLLDVQLAALREEHEHQLKASESATDGEAAGSNAVGDENALTTHVAQLLDRSLSKSDVQRLHLWLDTHFLQACKMAPSLATFTVTIRDEKDGGPWLQLIPPKRRSSTPVQHRPPGATAAPRVAPTASGGTTPPARTGVHLLSSGAHRSPAVGLHSSLSPALGSKSLALHAWGTAAPPRSATPPASAQRTAVTLTPMSKTTPLNVASRRTGSPGVTTAAASPQAKLTMTSGPRAVSKSPSISRPVVKAISSPPAPSTSTATTKLNSLSERRGSSPAASRGLVKVVEPAASSPAAPKIGGTKGVIPARPGFSGSGKRASLPAAK